MDYLFEQQHHASSVALAERPQGLQELFQLCQERQASDLHLVCGEPPILRVHGALVRLPLPVLQADALEAMLSEVLSATLRERFDQHNDVDFALTLAGVGRFRVNIHRERGMIGAAFRWLPLEIPCASDLGLSETIIDLARRPNGLVLITGPTGMGKSTTTAALVNVINHERSDMIISIEDPIEFVHGNHKSVIRQREVAIDTPSFASALRHALRQDPDVIVVGEMRDLETIAIALTAAETGHLVLATLHTPDAPQTLERIIDVFPPHQQAQVRLQLANCLQGIVAQQLLPLASGKGRVLATEVLINTSAVRNLIREQQTVQINSLIQTGAKYGMQTMDKALKELVKSGKITQEIALSRCRYPEDFHRL